MINPKNRLDSLLAAVTERYWRCKTVRDQQLLSYRKVKKGYMSDTEQSLEQYLIFLIYMHLCS